MQSHPVVGVNAKPLPIMLSLTHLVADYRALLDAGKTIEVIEKYYDDAIVQIENDGPPLVASA